MHALLTTGSCWSAYRSKELDSFNGLYLLTLLFGDLCLQLVKYTVTLTWGFLWKNEMDPKNSAPYVLLSNMYSKLGSWRDAPRVGKLMKQHGVVKESG